MYIWIYFSSAQSCKNLHSPKFAHIHIEMFIFFSFLELPPHLTSTWVARLYFSLVSLIWGRIIGLSLTLISPLCRSLWSCQWCYVSATQRQPRVYSDTSFYWCYCIHVLHFEQGLSRMSLSQRRLGNRGYDSTLHLKRSIKDFISLYGSQRHGYCQCYEALRRPTYTERSKNW